MTQEGTSTAPIASPWQGVAQLAKAMLGGYLNNKAAVSQRFGQANATADMSNALNEQGFLNDPGQQTSIPDTPGRTTPALQQNDQINDATADNEGNGMSSNAALLAALAASRGGSPSAGGVLAGGAPPYNSNPALAAMMAGAPAPATGSGPLNNPGNLADNTWTHSLPGYVGASPNGHFAVFDTPQDGAATMGRNLASYAKQA